MGGLKGVQGSKAQQGNKGLKGVKGRKGIKGYSGNKGLLGEKGIKGVKGFAGERGFPLAPSALRAKLAESEAPFMNFQAMASKLTGTLAVACIALGLVLFSIIVMYVREVTRYRSYKKMLLEDCPSEPSLSRRSSGP